MTPTQGLAHSLNDYQGLATETAVYPRELAVTYPAMGLAGEVGELLNKLKKKLRQDDLPDTFEHELAAELGDVLWYVAVLAHDLGFSLSQIANENLLKLQLRKKAGTIKGSGDKR